MKCEAKAEGIEYYGLAKISHKGFCLTKVNQLVKDWPGGSYLVLKSTTRVPGGRPLMEIGYNYNSRRFRVLIATEGSGSTEPGNPYLSYLPDIFSNVDVCPVPPPHLLGRYLHSCKPIDNQNRMWQYYLALEKYLVTQSGYFRLLTIVVLDMGIIDGKLIFYYGISEGSVENNF